MYVVNFSKWDTSRVAGQEQLLVDAWLEMVAEDGSPVCWPPLYSTLQLLRNLQVILLDVERNILKTYHVRDAADEILDRLDKETWLEDAYRLEMGFLKEQLRIMRERIGETFDDIEARRNFLSLLKGFHQKVEADDPLRKLRGFLCDEAADRNTQFRVVIRAVGELLNELIHWGHSRAHLHRWVLRGVVGLTTRRTYLEVIRESQGLITEASRPYRVLFHVACPDGVVNIDGIHFNTTIPAEFALAPDSIFNTDLRAKFAIIDVPEACDVHIAVTHARRALRRYLFSTRLSHLEFDRSISKHAAVYDTGSQRVEEQEESPLLRNRLLYNDERFYALEKHGRNEQTFAELDRIIFWLEQSRQAEELGSLIAQWTALEFLCSVPGKCALDAISEFVPAYIVPSLPRWLLLDFWKYLIHTRLQFSPELQTRLGVNLAAKPRGRPMCDLVALLDVCLDPEASNPIKVLIGDYPILLAKWYRIRSLDPKRRPVSEDMSEAEKLLVFDLRTCYRARNTIVHDAALDLVQVDRVAQRLNWDLCATLDKLLYQFCQNPRLMLADLHRCNRASYQKWSKDLSDLANSVTLDMVVRPPIYFLKS